MRYPVAHAGSLSRRRRHRGTFTDIVLLDAGGRIHTKKVSSRDGHRVTVCADGEAAIASLTPGNFDLVITDLGMPGMSGWDVARLVKSRAPRMPVAMVTGWGDGIDQAAAAAHGVDYVIPKPFRRIDLQRVMHSVLGGGADAPINAPMSAASK